MKQCIHPGAEMSGEIKLCQPLGNEQTVRHKIVRQPIAPQQSQQHTNVVIVS